MCLERAVPPKQVRVKAEVTTPYRRTSPSPTAWLLRWRGRAGTQNARLTEAVISSTGASVPAQWTRRRRCRCLEQLETANAAHQERVHALQSEHEQGLAAARQMHAAQQSMCDELSTKRDEALSRLTDAERELQVRAFVLRHVFGRVLRRGFERACRHVSGHMFGHLFGHVFGRVFGPVISKCACLDMRSDMRLHMRPDT